MQIKINKIKIRKTMSKKMRPRQ